MYPRSHSSELQRWVELNSKAVSFSIRSFFPEIHKALGPPELFTDPLAVRCSSVLHVASRRAALGVVTWISIWHYNSGQLGLFDPPAKLL